MGDISCLKEPVNLGDIVARLAANERQSAQIVAVFD